MVRRYLLKQKRQMSMSPILLIFCFDLSQSLFCFGKDGAATCEKRRKGRKKLTWTHYPIALRRECLGWHAQ
jgi:hypothetical protein